MTSRSWNYIAIGTIVIVIVFLLLIATPALGIGPSGIFFTLAIAFVLAVAITLFYRVVAGIFVLRAKANGRPTYSEFVFGRSKQVALLRAAIVVVLSLAGLAVLMLVWSLQLFHPGLGHRPSVPVANAVTTSPQPQTPQQLYLDLLKKNLTRAQMAGRYERYTIRHSPVNGPALAFIEPILHHKGYDLVGLRASNAQAYMSASYENSGRLDDAETMVGLTQLDNVQSCVEDALRKNVPGDLIEAGAWRGGITILMRGVLKAYGDQDRKVWVADSFEGLPPVDQNKDTSDYYEGQMAVSIDEVKENFARYGLLDDRVHFLKGFFNETLPGAPIEKLALFRADADLYESTMDALNNLYPKLSIGGCAIFDDYVQDPAVKRAIDEYRASHHITEPIRQIDGQAVYWQRLK